MELLYPELARKVSGLKRREQVLAGTYQKLEVQPEKICADITEAIMYILSGS